MYKELYEEHVVGEARIAVCRLCQAQSRQHKSGIANFKMHLSTSHPLFLLEKDQSSSSYSVRGGQYNGEEARGGPSTTDTISVLQFALHGAPSTSKLSDWLAEYCAEGCLPLSVVDSPAMQKLLLRLMEGMPRVPKLPSRYSAQLSLGKLLEARAAAVKERVARAIECVGRFPGMIAMTADTWTSRSQQGYLGVTIAYIDRDWRLQSDVVACKLLESPHTAPAIVNGIEDTVPEPAVMADVMTLVTDNGANMIAAARSLVGERALGCAAHTIQLVLKDAARQQPMKDILGCVTTALARFRNSTSRRQALADACNRAGIKALVPLYPIATRWDSNYLALRRFLEMYPALERMAWDDWGFASNTEHSAFWVPVKRVHLLLEPLCDVLGTFAGWTRALQSAGSVTLSRIPAAVQDMIAATAARTGDSEKIAEIKGQLHAAVHKRLVKLAESPLVQIARFLDPTQQRSMDAASVNDTVLMLIDIVNDRFRAVHSPNTTTTPWSHKLSACNGWPADQLGTALDAYVNLDKSNATDALDWWRAHAGMLSPMDAVARWFLCLPATSAESERTFSLAGLVATSRRSRLSGPLVNDLVLLHRHLARDRQPPSATRRTLGQASALGVAAAASQSIMPLTAIVEPMDDRALDALLDDGLVEVDERGILHVADGTTDAEEAVTKSESEANPVAGGVDSAWDD
jgi:hypothetical protein